MNHALPHLLLGSALLLLAPTPAEACKCAEQSIEDALRDASAVFEGRVRASREEGGVTTVRLHVVRVFRGASDHESYEVRTRSESAACGVELEPDTSYLVYATTQDGALWTHACSRTRPIDRAAEDLAVLGMGVTPFEPAASDAAPLPPSGTAAATHGQAPARGGCASCSIGAPPKSATPTASMLGWASWLGAVLGARLTCRRRYRSRP